MSLRSVSLGAHSCSIPLKISPAFAKAERLHGTTERSHRSARVPSPPSTGRDRAHGWTQGGLRTRKTDSSRPSPEGGLLDQLEAHDLQTAWFAGGLRPPTAPPAGSQPGRSEPAKSWSSDAPSGMSGRLRSTGLLGCQAPPAQVGTGRTVGCRGGLAPGRQLSPNSAGGQNPCGGTVGRSTAREASSSTEHFTTRTLGWLDRAEGRFVGLVS